MARTKPDQDAPQSARWPALLARNSERMSQALRWCRPAQEERWLDHTKCVASSVRQLKAAIESRHPQAPPAYIAARCWLALHWQAAFLSVLGAHCAGVVVNLSGLQQRRVEDSMAGYHLSGGARQPQLARTVPLAARTLSDWAHALHSQCHSLLAISWRSASRLLGDTVGIALQQLPSSHHRSSSHLQHDCQRWHEQLGLPRQPRWLATSPPQYQRGACCLHFLVSPEALCSNCPRHYRQPLVTPVKDDES